MKRLSLILWIVVVIFCFSACGNGDSENTTVSDTDSGLTTEETTVSDDVFLYIKNDMIESVDSFKEGLSEYEGIIFNEGNSHLVVQMDSDTYTVLIENENLKVKEKFDSFVGAEGGYVTSIGYDENFRSIKVSVDRESFDSVARNNYYEVVNLASPALYYQMFLPNGQQAKVSLVYGDNQEEICTHTVPMKFE